MNTQNEAEILLVEDSPSDAELALRALKNHNLCDHLVWVKDGAEALAFFFGSGGNSLSRPAAAPKLVLLDLKLPKVDGLEVLRRLKSDEQTRTIPVVVLTSSCEDRDVAESYHSGANSFIVKPVDYARFSETVVQVSLYWILLNQPAAVSATSTKYATTKLPGGTPRRPSSLRPT
jgi:two-component system response regulator